MKNFLLFISRPFKKFLSDPAVRYKLLESNLFSPHPDELIFKYAFEFINHHGIEGDYLEFGVWKGRSFARACNIWKHLFQSKGKLNGMRFFAFDSFQGLPDTSESPEFKKGQYFSTEKSFKENIASQGVELSRVITVSGWFKDTLDQATKARLSLKKAAVVFIDCDLYESAKLVLNFLADLVQDGTVLIFDDWFAFRGRFDKGEQKAVEEWLKDNQKIKLIEWQNVNWRGKAFIVNIKK